MLISPIVKFNMQHKAAKTGLGTNLQMQKSSHLIS